MHSAPNFYNGLHLCYPPILFSYKTKQKNTAHILILVRCLAVFSLVINLGILVEQDNTG